MDAIDWERIACCLCQKRAVAIYHMERGCIAISNRVQALCYQHVVTMEAVGRVQLIAENPSHELEKYFGGIFLE
jgi:hypothetical protein